MGLLTVVFVTGLIAVLGMAATLALCIGVNGARLSTSDVHRRIAEIAPYLAVTALFLVVKQATSGISLRISRTLDWNITDSLYAVEGLFVARLQNAVPEATYGFFSVMYMFAFPYLLFVPLLLYFLLPSQRRLKELLVAYVLNYFVGAICYTLFIAYGPRNWISSHVDGVMYELYPQTQELTAAVSSGTNVFPSLHTSLSVIVLLFAWRTRRTYPEWFYIAAFTASSIVLSTMVLGIHWLSDIVAGIALGVWCVVVASRIVARVEGDADRLPSVDEDEDGVRRDVGD